MFGEKVFLRSRGKKASTSKKTPTRLPNTPSGASTSEQGAAKAGPSGQAADDAALCGLTIEDFAKKYAISTAEVWRRLREGELIGRTERGRLIVYEPLPPQEGKMQQQQPKQRETPGSAASPLPPLPFATGEEGALAADGTDSSPLYLTLAGAQGNTPEVALLLDHLSLAKEENREILRLTQESIRKVTALTEAIVSAKDELLAARKAELDALRQRIEAQEREIRQLRQANEDLEMLARSIAAESQPQSR